MHRKRQSAVAAFIAVFLLLVGVSWVCGHRVQPASRRLRFEAGDGSVSPLFVLITRGRLETNLSPAPGVTLARMYIHTFYCASQGSVQPVPALRYWVDFWVGPKVEAALRLLGVRHRALVRPNITLPTSTDTSVLWFGYRATNAITSEDAVVVSDQGSRLALTPVVDTSQTNHSEHLMIWKLPSLLTNRGKYRLTLPRANQTLLTFDYE